MGELIMIDITEASRLLRDAVQTQGPGFVYASDGRSCYYLPQDFADPDDPRSKTGCLIGVALKLAGVDVKRLERYGSVQGFAGLHEELGFRLTVDAAQYFSIAQTVQDQGGSWGMAQIAAEAFRHSLNWTMDW